MKPEINISEIDYLEVVGARVHNLKNIDVTIPRNKLVVITGLSGSGKSSLAFDTIYAEGQRRYIESFSAYARQFLGNMERPDVDKITGLSPVISIEQKTVNKNPRSTVGTITEIYDFLRLLYARSSEAYSYVTGERMVRYSDDQIIQLILEKFQNKKILILAPVIKGRKGHYRELFEQIKKWGYLRVRVDGEVLELTKKFQLDRYKVHDIEIVIDRLEVTTDARPRISESMQLAMKQGKGIIMVQPFQTGKLEEEYGKVEFYSRHLMCPASGISYDEPQPNLFSFNSPYGACPKCNGLGMISEVDINKIIPNKKLSIRKGGIAPLGTHKSTWIFKQLEAIGDKYGFNLDTPLEDISDEAINTILFGSDEIFKIKEYADSSATSYSIAFEGIANFIIKQNDEQSSPTIEKWILGFMNKVTCTKCNGTKLKMESLQFKIDKKNIAELSEMGIIELNQWFKDIEKRLSAKQNTIAKEVLKEIRTRIQFLLDVGLDYLSLNRSSRTLSGGEAQRIKLAKELSRRDTGNTLYILDEPTTGLHFHDVKQLVDVLLHLQDCGNTIVIIEHNLDVIKMADWIIDLGPEGGDRGGKIVAMGTPEQVAGTKGSYTGEFLANMLNAKKGSKKSKVKS